MCRRHHVIAQAVFANLQEMATSSLDVWSAAKWSHAGSNKQRGLLWLMINWGGGHVVREGWMNSLLESLLTVTVTLHFLFN